MPGEDAYIASEKVHKRRGEEERKHGGRGITSVFSI